MKTKFRVTAVLSIAITGICLAAQPVEITFQDPARGVIQMINGIEDKNLKDCHITWMLLENGHLIEAATMAEIAGEYGAVVNVEFPYANKPFRYGGERWIRVEIREKKDDGSGGRLLAWEQFKIPELTSPSPRPFGAGKMPKLEVSINKTLIQARNNLFSVAFDKKSGLISSLVYYKEEQIRSGLSLTYGPDSELPAGKLLNIEHAEISENILKVLTHIRYDGDNAAEHFVDYIIYGDGTIRVNSRLKPAEPGKHLPLAGLTMKLRNMTKFGWYGNQPDKPYSEDRKGTPIQIHQTESDTLKKKGMSTGPLTNVRWISKTSEICKGMIFCHINTYLRARINVENKSDSEIFIAPQPPLIIDGAQTFNFRIRRFDSILDFADRLWYTDAPAEDTGASDK